METRRLAGERYFAKKGRKACQPRHWRHAALLAGGRGELSGAPAALFSLFRSGRLRRLGRLLLFRRQFFAELLPPLGLLAFLAEFELVTFRLFEQRAELLPVVQVGGRDLQDLPKEGDGLISFARGRHLFPSEVRARRGRYPFFKARTSTHSEAWGAHPC